MKQVAIAAAACALFTQACASVTTIHSIPDGAKLYIDSEPRGQTPYTYSDTKIIGSSTEVRLVKDGYQDFQTQIRRMEEPNVGAIIGGFFFWPIWLWAADYKHSYQFELQPKQAAPGAHTST